jgi:hypothetical protein
MSISLDALVTPATRGFDISKSDSVDFNHITRAI